MSYIEDEFNDNVVEPAKTLFTSLFIGAGVIATGFIGKKIYDNTGDRKQKHLVAQKEKIDVKLEQIAANGGSKVPRDQTMISAPVNNGGSFHEEA